MEKVITVVGMGYVGLGMATMLSQHSYVCMLDIDKKRVDSLNKQHSPIEDKDVSNWLKQKALHLEATDSETKAYSTADIVIIATPTNYDSDKHYFDTSSVEQSLCNVTKLCPNALVVIKSTVPVGFTERMRTKYPKLKLVFSPEFLRETKALYDNLYPSRIIFGFDQSDTDLKSQVEHFADLLRNSAHKRDIPIIFMTSTEAEAVKLFANTYLAMRISFFNELDTYAYSNHLDSKSIIEGVGLDPRIGDYYNNPSFGYGGYCLPKDTKQLLSNFDNIPQDLIQAIVSSNDTRKDYIANKIIERVKSLRLSQQPVIGIYRLTMKSNSDNFRDSSIQGIIRRLNGYRFRIIIFEPQLRTEMWHNFEVINEFEEFASQSHVIVANRYSSQLDSVEDKIFTRDIFYRD
ncbi:MAG: nucleotide sugar dehydrogenase [Streptococcus orisratti]|uniref:nucleotide sugar dehydrogenase n=1 Tax=Streptococcus orisratti TaxID=114652 RepID=UPI002A91DA1E|nr:nucleotide sugar dehydrogenase [Streptococcus orisratti]MDY5635497.1 nucleotide sugar dehydrogenase [Streptococcus orisratti]